MATFTTPHQKVDYNLIKNHFKYKINFANSTEVKCKFPTQLDSLNSNFHVNNKVQKVRGAII